MQIKSISYHVIILLICLQHIIVSGYSQLYFEIPKSGERSVTVRDEAKKVFKYPWAGGLNSCQFNEIDLDFDGDKDLVIFDRMGDRILPFINGGSANTIDYNYDPQFIQCFPEIFDWMILVDYNNDGLEDIFTYSFEFPGIVVYKNTSVNELKFELEVYPYLTSLQGGGYVNILVTYVDYPAIEDIDNDGDMDILTFWGLGSFVEYHQNQSMELYGIPDSLIFIEVTQCWGYFAENDESNVIYLDTCLGGPPCNSTSIKLPGDSQKSRHTGSTFLLLDLDNDQDKDLLLGDVDYPNLIELMNGGTPDSAYMISQDPEFPAYDQNIRLFSLPLAKYIDVNNNGVKDLVVSPFDPSPVTSENFESVWLYMNNGQNNQPQLTFEKPNFIQDDMIDVGSGAYPVFADYDGDGLVDLFVSNYGYYIYSHYLPGMFLESIYWSAISLFKNTGSETTPEFTRITHNFEDLQALELKGLYPSFADLDEDADLDMVVGFEEGTLMYFENVAEPSGPMQFGDPVLNFQNIDVGNFSTPQLFDLDRDGLTDLIVGEEDGNLNFYRNNGSPGNPAFILVTDSLGKVDVRAPEITFTLTGYSIPHFFINNQDEIELLVGSEQGKIHYYRDVENNLNGIFTESDSLFLNLDENPIKFPKYMRSAPALTELDGDTLFELIIGNFSGGVQYFEGSNPPGVAGDIESISEASFSCFPNPFTQSLYISCSDPGVMTEIHFEIADMASRIVRSVGTYSIDQTKLELHDLQPGIYILKIESTNGAKHRFIKKIVKTN